MARATRAGDDATERARALVPVTMGSPRFRELDAASLSITDAWFPPGAVLHSHTHARAIFGVMLEGSFETTIGRRRLACVPGSAWVEPAEERHMNVVGRYGARCIVLQADLASEQLGRTLARLLDEPRLVVDAHVAQDAL